MLSRLKRLAGHRVGPFPAIFALVGSAYVLGCVASFAILPPLKFLAEAWSPSSGSNLPVSQRVLGDSATPTPQPLSSSAPLPAPPHVAQTSATDSYSGSTTVTVASLGGVGFAAGSSLPELSDALLASDLSGMKALHATWVRFDIQWDQVEPNGPSNPDWSAYDRVVSAVIAHGLRPIAILDFTPAWARSSYCSDSTCPPANPSDYANFAAAAVNHYKSQGVHVWEIWNEPNNSQFFDSPNASAYVGLLRTAYPAIKHADPSATVLTGGLAPAGGSDEPDLFLAAIYQAGARGYFDAVADHPYTFPATALTNNPYDTWGQMIQMRSVMVANGDASKKIWITEYGAPTGGPNGISEAAQVQMVSDFFNESRTLPWLGPILWYSYRDAGTTQDTVENWFGLVSNDGQTKKPAYYTFQQLAASY